MAGEPSLADKVSEVHRALAGAGIAHAFGGAMALAYYGEPRVTIDIDVNLFVPAEEFPRIAGVLSPLGVDPDAGPGDAMQDGQIRIWWGRNAIDLFFAYDPFHQAMRRDSRTVEFSDGTIPILSPEHLIVCKAVFDRPKDWIDIEQMMIGVDVLDRSEITDRLERIVGREDERFGRIEEIWAGTR